MDGISPVSTSAPVLISGNILVPPGISVRGKVCRSSGPRPQDLTDEEIAANRPGHNRDQEANAPAILPVLDHPPVVRLKPASAFTYNTVVLLWALSTVAATLSIATAAGLTWQRLVAVESQLAQNARV